MPDIVYESPYPNGWRDLPDNSTPLNARALQALDDGVAAATAQANDALAGGSGSGSGPAALPGVVADGATDNAAAFAALSATGSGAVALPYGTILCKSPIVIPRRTQLLGKGTNPLGSTAGTTIKFDASALMTGGNSASVVANGSTWVFTVPAGHGLKTGNVIGLYGFAHDGFNSGKVVSGTTTPFGFKLASVTSTTLTVTNSAVPAGTDAGFVNPFMVVFGDTVNNTPAGYLADVTIDCSDIPGAGGVYANNIQEMSGCERVTIIGCRWRGIQIDGSGAFGTTQHPLNYLMRDLRVLSSAALSTAEKAVYVGYDEYGGAVSNRGVNNITCANGSSVLTAMQVRFNKANGLRTNIHTEDSTDGILIGDQVGCRGLTVESVTGTSTTTNVIRIVNNTSVPNQQIDVGAVYRNGATNVFLDDANTVVVSASLTSYLGRYTTDITSAVAFTTLTTFAPATWAASTAYFPTQFVALPDGSLAVTTVGYTSRSTFDTTESGAWTRIFSAGGLSWSSLTPASASNSTSKTTLVTSPNFATTLFAAGTVVRARYAGSLDNVATSGTFTAFLECNGTTVWSGQIAPSITGAGTVQAWFLDVDVYFDAVGSGGSISVVGQGNGVSAAGGVSNITVPSVLATAVNLSGGAQFTFRVTMGTASASNVFRVNRASIKG